MKLPDLIAAPTSSLECSKAFVVAFIISIMVFQFAVIRASYILAKKKALSAFHMSVIRNVRRSHAVCVIIILILVAPHSRSISMEPKYF
jgi:hypothetical protein